LFNFSATPAVAPATGTGGLFGTASATTGGGLFGSASTSVATSQSGTKTKYNPLIGQDVTMKYGIQTSVNTKHQCITSMKEYEAKSLEV